MSELFISIAAIWTAGVATLGLGTWRSHLRDRTRYEATLALLKAIQAIRFAIERARMDPDKAPPSIDEPEEAHTEEKQLKLLQERFRNRQQSDIKAISKALEDLQFYAIEAEANWGQLLWPTLQPLEKSALAVIRRKILFLRSVDPILPDQLRTEYEQQIESDFEFWSVLAISEDKSSKRFGDNLKKTAFKAEDEMRILISKSRATALSAIFTKAKSWISERRRK